MKQRLTIERYKGIFPKFKGFTAKKKKKKKSNHAILNSKTYQNKAVSENDTLQLLPFQSIKEKKNLRLREKFTKTSSTSTFLRELRNQMAYHSTQTHWDFHICSVKFRPSQSQLLFPSLKSNLGTVSAINIGGISFSKHGIRKFQILEWEFKYQTHTRGFPLLCQSQQEMT